MRTSMRFLLPIVIAIFLTSCALVWEPYERSRLGKINTQDQASNKNMIERLISVPVGREHPSARNFDLYYFVRMPDKGRAPKTVLYIAGGPGEVIPGPMLGVSFVDFLTENGYNIVFFHQRGAGFSQLPESNHYDRFLKTEYAVNDIDAIRKDFLGEHGKWDAIIGYSYGTVVAQQYAHFYALAVDRVILIGPMSRDTFKYSLDAFDKITDEIRSTDRSTLSKIFEFDEFKNIAPQKNRILNEVFGANKKRGVFDKAEDAFGSLGFIIDSYCELKTKNELQKYQLDKYSKEFFQSLRSLHLQGVNSPEGNQILLGRVIAREILWPAGGDDCSGHQVGEEAGSSDRNFYVIGTYDGINMRFLKEWVSNGKKHILDALKKSSGEANKLRNVNESIGKVGISNNEIITPWDPADYPNKRPTLVVKGNADTVPAGGAAKRFFFDALIGRRTLIEVPGMGHSPYLPGAVQVTEPILSGAIRADPPLIKHGETRSVRGVFSGRILDQNWRMNLATDELERGLRLVGFGILGDQNGNLRNDTLDINVLIENTGTQPVNAIKRIWTLSSPLLSGSVEIEPGLIQAGEIKEVIASVTGNWRIQADKIRLQTSDIEPGLDLLVCLDKIGEGRFLRGWFKNKNTSGNSIDGRPGKWKASMGAFSQSFWVDPPPVGPQEMIPAIIDFPGLDELEEVDLIKPTQLERNLGGCLPVDQEKDNPVSIVLFNADKNQAHGGVEREWQIENSMFKATFKVTPPSSPLPPQHAIKLTGTDLHIEWKKPPEVIPPKKLIGGLKLRSFNISGENEVSLLIHNGSQAPLDDMPRDWIYIDPKDRSLACFPSGTNDAGWNCLIYSFLVMDPATFSDYQENEILRMLKVSKAHICYADGDNQPVGSCSR